MPATLISGATLDNATGPGASFTSTTAFMIACDRGTVGLQVQLGSDWYDYSDINDQAADRLKIKAMCAITVPALFASANYRLTTPEGKTSAKVYSLT